MTYINSRLLFSTFTLCTFSLFLLLTSTISYGQRPYPRKEFGPPPGRPDINRTIFIPTPTPSPRYVIPSPTPATSSPIPIPVAPDFHRHPEHPPMVIQEWREPLNMIWNCKLNRQPCELKNGVNFIPFETENRFGQETITANLSKAAQIFDGRLPQPNPKLSFKASRLWTKNYFPARYRNACLFFSYAMSGRYHKQLYLMQRNGEDICVYSAEQGSSGISQSYGYKRWIDTEIQLDLKFGDARFFIDFEYELPTNSFNYQEFGMVDIRNFSIAYGNCNRNDGNECDSVNKIDHE